MSLASACLALPVLQPQPPLCFAAHRAHLTCSRCRKETQKSSPCSLLFPIEPKHPLPFPPEQPDSGVPIHGWSPEAGPVCIPYPPLPLSFLITHEHNSPVVRYKALQISYQLTTSKRKAEFKATATDCPQEGCQDPSVTVGKGAGYQCKER